MRATLKKALFALTFLVIGALLQPAVEIVSTISAAYHRTDTTSGHNALRQLSLGLYAYKLAVEDGSFKSPTKYPSSLAELASSGYFPKQDMDKILDRWNVEYFPPSDDADLSTITLLIEDERRVMYMRLGGDGRQFGTLK